MRRGNSGEGCPVCSLENKPYHESRQDPETSYCECTPEDGAEMDFDSLLDWRGNEIVIGDVIAYPYLSGRSAAIATGVIERIYVKASSYGYSKWQCRLKVMPIERGFWDSSEQGALPEDRRRSTLQFWDRCILLEAKR